MYYIISEMIALTGKQKLHIMGKNVTEKMLTGHLGTLRETWRAKGDPRHGGNLGNKQGQVASETTQDFENQWRFDTKLLWL